MDKHEVIEWYKEQLKYELTPKQRTYIEKRIVKLEQGIKLQKYYDEHPDELDKYTDVVIRSKDGTKKLYRYGLGYVFTERDDIISIDEGRVSVFVYAKNIYDAHRLLSRRFRLKIDPLTTIYPAHIKEIHKSRE